MEGILVSYPEMLASEDGLYRILEASRRRELEMMRNDRWQKKETSASHARFLP